MYINIVSADSVTDVVAVPGAVNCVISFNCADSSDSIKIYYDTSSSVSTGDSSTYTDPEDCTYSNRVSRKMIIRGLTESTTYYYRLYSTDDSSWCASESSFTTLPRFTDSWKDEFFDDYLIDDSYNIDLEQSVGVKSGVLIPDGDSGWNDTGYNYITVFNDSGTWRFYGSARPDADAGAYTTSNDGVNWDSNVQQLSLGFSPNSRFYFNIINVSGVYWCYFTEKVSVGSNTDTISIASASSPDGTYNIVGSRPIISETDYDDNEMHPSGFFRDYLGANTWNSYGQQQTSPRKIGQYLGFNDTDLMGFDSFINIPEVGGDNVYVLPCDLKSGCYVGFNHRHESGGTEYVRPYLTISRNGFDDWSNFDSSTPIIPLGSNGEWDDGVIYTCWTEDNILNDGEYDYIYYVGADGVHGTGPTKQVGRIRFRQDGITYVDPQSNGAWLRTVSINENFSANFSVNFDGDGSSSLDIAVLDADTDLPYENFDFDDFDTITTDSVSHSPSWGSNTLSDIPSGDFKLNFSWTIVASGELFSYSMDNATREDSIIIFSINDQLNNTELSTASRYFNWSNMSGVVGYNLQIANDTGFTDVFLDLDDVNESNYGVNFTMVGDYVEFILPSVYNIEWLGSHYYRVRPKYFGVDS